MFIHMLHCYTTIARTQNVPFSKHFPHPFYVHLHHRFVTTPRCHICVLFLLPSSTSWLHLTLAELPLLWSFEHELSHLPSLHASPFGSVANSCPFVVTSSCASELRTHQRWDARVIQPSAKNLAKTLMPFSNTILVHVIFLFFCTLQETVHFSELNMCNSRRYCFYWLVVVGLWKIPQPWVKPRALNFPDHHGRQTLLVWFFELLTDWRLSQLGMVNLLRA
jgi:hypothetical protein